MEVVYVSSACNPDRIDQINRTAKRKLEVSGIKFHNLLMRGLSENNVQVKSIIGLPISNNTNKKIFWKKQIDEKKNIQYYQVGFINLPILKQITTAFNIFIKYINCTKGKSEIYTIIDGTYISVLPFIHFANKFLHIKTIAIIADIYNYMCDVENDNGKGKLLNKFIKKRNKKLYSKMDGFILLTKQMNEVINLEKKPYLVIEGCSDINMKNVNDIEKNDKRIILYSGKLAEKFGIKLLVEGFKKLKQKDIELWIYGDGEEKEYIIEEARKNTLIKYKGLVSNEEVVKSQMKATLLVNPRPTKKEFTKYSFPSKNIEYMASGTPILTTKLPGMPEEYYDYVYIIENETEEGMAETLNSILKLTSEELILKGKIAKNFILNNKNEIIQSKKIIEFLIGEKNNVY